MLIWLLPVQVVWVAPRSVLGRCAATTRFGSMFDFGEIVWSIRHIGDNVFAVWIVHFAALALSFVTIWTPAWPCE